MPQSVATTTSAAAMAIEVGTLCRRLGNIVSVISKRSCLITTPGQPISKPGPMIEDTVNRKRGRRPNL
jgi:hypothetical protein